jgi:hypothetical protein
MQEKNLRTRITAFYHSVHLAAHRAEHPLHMSYLAAVFYSSNAAYGTIALLCALTMLLAWERV